jgi:hypothetical protein
MYFLEGTMNKAIRLFAVLAAFGLVATALACAPGDNTCNKSDSVTQKITVHVPTVVRLVIDSNVNTKKLDAWNINLANNANQDLSSCYVVPNWVGQDGGLSLFDFLDKAHGHLLSAATYGYPPIITGESGKVLTWSEVVAQNDGLATVYQKFPDARAKGNLVCMNDFMVEKYTNCPGVSFYVSLDSLGDTPNTGFGDLYITDVTKVNGTNAVVGAQSTDAISYTGHFYDLTPNEGFKTGVFYDDYISQMLWLQPSQPGTYRIKATYTLGSALN